MLVQTRPQPILHSRNRNRNRLGDSRISISDAGLSVPKNEAGQATKSHRSLSFLPLISITRIIRTSVVASASPREIKYVKGSTRQFSKAPVFWRAECSRCWQMKQPAAAAVRKDTGSADQDDGIPHFCCQTWAYIFRRAF